MILPTLNRTDALGAWGRFFSSCFGGVLRLALLALATARVEAEPAKPAGALVEQKLDSNIVLALKKSRGQPPFDQPSLLQPSLALQPDGRVLVEIDATISEGLLAQIAALGGAVIGSFPRDHNVQAALPLGGMEALAARPDVRFIGPSPVAVTNPRPAPHAPVSSPR